MAQLDFLLFTAILAALICLSAFFSGMEVAFVSLSRLRLKALMKKGIKGAEAAYRIKKDQHKFLVTILICNNIVNVAAASIATYLATEAYGSSGVGIATGAITFLLLVFGEITPKNLAYAYAEELSLFFARPFELVIAILSPVIFFFESISNSLIRLFGKKPDAPLITEEYLRAMFEVGVEEEVLEPSQKEYLERVLKFRNTSVKAAMVPKSQIFSLPESMKASQAARFLAKNPYSRIPVFSKTGKIRGAVYSKDLLSELSEGQGEKTLKELAKPVLYVREDVANDRLLRHFQKTRIHLAMVIDHSNAVVGLITLEDLVEEIVGEIFDEQDVKKMNADKH